jgi:hypothetical protein
MNNDKNFLEINPKGYRTNNIFSLISANLKDIECENIDRRIKQ